MSISKHTVLVACIAAGGLAVAGLPAQAASPAGRPALACAYQVTHVRPISFLNVRAGGGLRFHRVGKRAIADGRFAGACKSVKGWVAVKASDGKAGWASARYLRKVRSTHHSGTTVLLACTYEVTHVRPISFLNVRAGGGLRFHRVGKRAIADGRFAGACKSVKGWVAVKASDGKAGWASARYLRKVTTK
ncbi:hypothetical protein [Nonomuraea sp. NPDC049784]|uniref:hypothetical protein n=1 Tax=Nonomuraea sp. NPDC049784 TaxID=3154361 RepID=UPI0033ED97D8